MTDDVIQTLLWNEQTRAEAHAQLHKKVRDKHISDAKTLWAPMLQNTSEQDAHWDWEKKHNKYQLVGPIFGWHGFALECDGQTQGLMYAEVKKQCRIPNQSAEYLAYIHFVATAPWNRPKLMTQLGSSHKYVGVGTIMVRQAINLSHENGLSGRIGLHSLPDAENFYRHHCGMTELGVDSKKHLTYFELTDVQADQFMSKYDSI